MRFYLKRLNPNAVNKIWVAEQAAQQIPETFGWGSSYSIFGGSWYEKTYSKGLTILNEAKQLYADYLKSGQITKEMIKSSILLAQLDKIYREGRFDRNFGVADDGDITDLENLIQLVKPEMFAAKKTCLLNPTFGHASNLVGGADADLLVDDILLPRGFLNQLISFLNDNHMVYQLKDQRPKILEVIFTSNVSI